MVALAQSARKRKVSRVLADIFRLLSRSPNMLYASEVSIVVMAADKELVHITDYSLETAVTSLTDSVFGEASSLSDTFVELVDFGLLAQGLAGDIKRLDHIGFCYTVASQEAERERIKKSLGSTRWHLYEMESNDFAKWYLIGDTKRWQDPMIELLPTLPNRDPGLPYWMPHVHVDINTSLTADEILNITKAVFGGTRKPTLYTDPEWGTHCVRIWLGMVAGVNIELDLSTKIRNLQWVRAHLLSEIVV